MIGGGYDKDASYDAWIESFHGKVKKLVLIGQTREKIAACARAHGFTDIILCESLEEAVDVCCQNAREGDAVFCSGLCKLGMFSDYEERGRIQESCMRCPKRDK